MAVAEEWVMMMPIMCGERGEVPVRMRPLRRTEYQHLTNGGAFEDERVELLAGALVEVGEGDAHDVAVERIATRLRQCLAGRARVYVQESLPINDFSMPRPDLVVWSADAHWGGSSRVRLVVEVAGRSVDKDRVVKGPLYASGAIDEYWLVDLGAGTIEVYAERDVEHGTWGLVETVTDGRLVALRADPSVCLSFLELRGESPAPAHPPLAPWVSERGGDGGGTVLLQRRR